MVEEEDATVVAMVVVREYDEKNDRRAVVEAESRCESGPAGKLSLYTDLMGDPICRVRQSPVYLMLVAELAVFGGGEDEERREIVGMIRGCIKNVTFGNGGAKMSRNSNKTMQTIQVYTKIGYVLGLRVSPYHRRMGIGLQLVRRMEQWFGQNGAVYSYMATENDNIPSIKLFTTRCGYTKFRTPSILVQPVFAHRVRTEKRVAIITLRPGDAAILYRRRFSSTEFFPSDIDAVLNNKLSLGTFLAVPRGSYSHSSWPGSAAFLAEPPPSWAVLSVWNCKEVFRLEVRGASRMQKVLAKTSRLLDRALPWLSLPSVPELFGPFGFHFLYGLGGEGPDSVNFVRALCGLAHNMAREHGCEVVVTEVASQDPLRLGIPHWKKLSCAEDLWCIKRLGGSCGNVVVDDCTMSPPGMTIFVDPREV